MKNHFITPLKNFVCLPYVKNGKWDGENWITLTDLVFRLKCGEMITIKSGFVTNFGSIPALVRPFLDRAGKSLRGFVAHDYSYGKDIGLTRKEADNLLYELGREDGEGWWDSQMIYRGLRLGGWTHWQKAGIQFEKPGREVIEYIARSNGYKLVK